MKNYIKYALRNLKIPALVLVLALSGFGIHKALAATALSTQLGIGSRGSEVSNLQSFLASNSSIYPAGLVTGYFGTLTSQAVANFQNAYDLPAVGRVGPMTLAKINQIIASGRGIDLTGPQMYGLSVSNLSSGQATINWSTNESSWAKVYYDTKPFNAVEASTNFKEPVFGAAWVTMGTAMSSTHSITLPNLTRGAVYYYRAVSVDASGNVSVSIQGSFTAI